MLQFSDVSKRFHSLDAIQSLDLAVEPHRSSVLIGPSGCGKSTLLRLAIGLLQPDSGEIRFDDTPLSPSSLPLLRQRMGYVIQEGGLFPHLTVQSNASLMAKQLRWPETRIQRRLQEVRELVRLPADLLSRYPAQLSGGQRQRVSLMRALMLDPELLLLDEPLGALDPMIRFALQQDLKVLFEQLNKTVVLVTHDLAEAAYFGHHLVLMRDGVIVQQGSFAELAKQPVNNFVREFFAAQREPQRLLNEAIS